MAKLFSHRVNQYLPELLLFIVFSIIQFTHLNIDFWNDEIYTIKHFILTPISNTLSDYHVPNNHIFFNLIQNIYLKLIGINNLRDVFETPWKLRIIPLIYSFATVYFTYQIGQKNINRTTGLLSIILLITTLPFYTFSLQIRGYGLSIMLGVVLVHQLLSYLKKPNTTTLITTGVIACLLFYTIPSNLYFLLSILFGLGIFSVQNHKTKSIISNKYSFLIYAISSGLLVGILLYTPIITDVFSNEYVKSGQLFNLSTLIVTIHRIAVATIYSHLIIIVLSSIGLIIGYTALIKHNLISFLSLCIIIIPLLIISIIGQSAPPRIFTLSFPFISILLSLCIYGGWNRYFQQDKRKEIILLFSIFLISIFSFSVELDKTEKKNVEYFHKNGRIQDLYYQYYSTRYSPLKSIKLLKSINKGKPVVVIDCEPHGIPNYLKEFNIQFYYAQAFDSLLNHCDSFYVITNHPFIVQNKNVTSKIINNEINYHNIISVQKK